ncbi:MAG: hypothetical protein ACI88A_003362, partial [Paraglaciecola sp.]
LLKVRIAGICSLYWHLRFIRYLNLRMACIRPVVRHQGPKQGCGKICELYNEAFFGRGLAAPDGYAN